MNQFDSFKIFICKENGKYMNSFLNRSSSLDFQGKINKFCISIT